MGISNVASNLRPGICTSSTRPTTPYEGQVIYETDTNRTLVWDNAAWVDPSTGKYERSGLVKVIPTGVSNGSIDSSGNITSGAGVSNISVYGAFNSSFDNYRIVTSGGTASTITGINMSLGGITTGYYSIRFGGFYSSPTTLNTESSNNGANWRAIGLQNPSGNFSVVDITTPFMSGVSTFISGHYIGGSVASFVVGRTDSTASVSSFTFESLSGTFSNMNIRIYGYN